VDIVTAFKRAGAWTLATDVNPLAPALYYADEHAFVPRVDDAGYVAALHDLVKAHDVGLIVPLTDLDHGVLARRRGELGALVLLPAWSDDLAHSLSLSTNVQANLPLALYGLVLIGVITVAPAGIQGAVHAVARRLEARRLSTPNEEGAAP